MDGWAADAAAVWTGAVLRGIASAAIVAALLLAARRWGRAAAGLLAGLPTVTGPALLWLALDHGPAFAAAAAAGAAAAGIACAVFALAYAVASRRHAPGATLALALAASALPLFVFPEGVGSLGAWTVLAVLVGLVCQQGLTLLAVMAAVLPVQARPAVPTAPTAPTAPMAAWRGGVLTAGVAGLVTAVAAAAAGLLGPFWAGVLSSPPLLAAAVAFELQRRSGPCGGVLCFLRGYNAGLLGRTLFVALFGAVLPLAGLAVALAAGLAGSALVTAWQGRPRRRAAVPCPRPITALVSPAHPRLPETP